MVRLSRIQTTGEGQMKTDLYEKPRNVESLSQCHFYHTMDLPGVGTVEGQWDLRGRLDDYIGSVHLPGRRVLDLGTASGFLSFEMEKRGAEVVSFDADSVDRFARLPFRNSLYTTNRVEWARQMGLVLDAVQSSYWLAHRLYGSRNKAFYGDVYDLPDDLGMFDIVVVGQILVHLRDPITALASAARRCADTLVIVEGMVDSNDPVMWLCADPDAGPDWSWWHLSVGLYRALLKMMGFEIIKLTENRFPCSHQTANGLVLLKTLQAHRKPVRSESESKS